jgi:multiple antibiotic resistance protein
MATFARSTGEMFGALFPMVSPIAALPVFLALTAHHPASERMKIAFKSALIVFAILIVFLFAGEPLLHHFGISLEGLQIAGGIIVGVSGLQMVMKDVHAREEGALDEATRTRDVSFSPLAIPLLAGPGALGVLMGLEARRSSELPRFGFILGIFLVALTVYVCFVLGGQVVRLIGEAGVDALNRVFGLLVMAIGVEMVVHGIATHQAFS